MQHIFQLQTRVRNHQKEYKREVDYTCHDMSTHYHYVCLEIYFADIEFNITIRLLSE